MGKELLEQIISEAFVALEPNCTQCRFFRYYDDKKTEDFGICRRNPPTPFIDDSGSVASVWPMVNDQNFCGEFIGST